MNRVARAIRIIEDCRDVHVKWSRWQRRERRAGRDWKRRVKAGSVGGPTFHRKWVRNYDFVLGVLRGQVR